MDNDFSFQLFTIQYILLLIANLIPLNISFIAFVFEMFESAGAICKSSLEKEEDMTEESFIVVYRLPNKPPPIEKHWPTVCPDEEEEVI